MKHEGLVGTFLIPPDGIAFPCRLGDTLFEVCLKEYVTKDGVKVQLGEKAPSWDPNSNFTPYGRALINHFLEEGRLTNDLPES